MQQSVSLILSFNKICELFSQLFVEIGNSHVILQNKNNDVCSGCVQLSRISANKLDAWIRYFPGYVYYVSRQFSSAWERQRGREEERESTPEGTSQGSRVIVGGWIECYDVLHHVVATKTMRLVTVIVRSVRLRAVTNRVVPTLRCNSLVVSVPLFHPLLPSRVMKRSFVLVLLFILATNSTNAVLLFQTGARENNVAPPNVANLWSTFGRFRICEIYIGKQKFIETEILGELHKTVLF